MNFTPRINFWQLVIAVEPPSVAGRLNSNPEEPEPPFTKRLTSLKSSDDGQFAKNKQADEATSAQVAKRFDYPIEEVNDAFASDSYRTYKVL